MHPRTNRALRALTIDQVESFWQQGFVTVANAVSENALTAMRVDLAGWVEDSKQHSEPYGETLSGRPRFDLEPGHCAAQPAVRRVASPTELSDAYLDVIQESPMLDMVDDLIGPDLRFHHSKVNSKLPDSGTKVLWHQDFTFDPHSNDDMITSLLFLDDVTSENGPLRVVPGSHRGPLLSLWQAGQFTGAVDERTAAGLETQAVEQTGPAGAVCLMHVRLLHSSGVNLSKGSRSLFIAGISAADAVPLSPNAVPSVHEGMLLRGREPGTIRSTAFEMEAPVLPRGASFFGQQEGQ